MADPRLGGSRSVGRKRPSAAALNASAEQHYQSGMAGIANMERYHAANQGLVDRNQRVMGSMGQPSPNIYQHEATVDQSHARFGMSPSMQRQLTPMSQFTQPPPLNGRYVGGGEAGNAAPPRLGMTQGVHGEPGQMYVPGRSLGYGDSHFVQNMTTPSGSRVVRNPVTGRLALFGEGQNVPAGNMTPDQFQDYQHVANLRDTENVASRLDGERERNGGLTRHQMLQQGEQDRVAASALARNPKLKGTAAVQAMLDRRGAAQSTTQASGRRSKARDEMLDQLYQQAILSKLKGMTPDQQMEFLQSMRGGGQGGGMGEVRQQPSAGSTFADAVVPPSLRDRMRRQGPLYPGRFGGY